MTAPDGLTVAWFDTTDQLTTLVKRDVMRLLISRFHDTHHQPTAQIIQDIIGDDNTQIASKNASSTQKIKGNKNKQEIR